ncbi:similar to Saccharomyces cerevisiae YGR038W ORM1 Evolutionarily conserved protein, similar to Orm2p, required for resistance to agents that induce unfolded protein response [Maudiozyma barnettii]|uniref:Similar to Saccharomyces cerevisiae YGR038W ORM1 Evolutionarily conserved protein, similar to Orm2p, required for resistance to agents that induce unfolded protein response n=1 Tax=Maudiozyma barnettii TaxID=61262 RepID=A0A8H2VL56_9SACH|nr:uncharacterized protein KABA2_14S00946 [Kazachstania barnettii]CAB4257295.1 similar to Saccharomyces cerevisiae YGR038W ORM1 Evolutionarily conserved protein, similar to Orm2p, required for resistance to agents that induce unfolded protein response [Kazachstania barnettii]CAD1784560.1 similar to Saccharomyces cerevisiae YGR038W ORM1 Evolutionarily conserved protein, similar to Orm2p, required for resistance to agents that induce unfolded protein response [Kazachstania barnettii]
MPSLVNVVSAQQQESYELYQAVSNTSDSADILPIKDHRRRRSSSIISLVEQESLEDDTDQRMLPNMNATWVDQRGAWVIHLVLIAMLKLFYNLMPRITNDIAWTMTNATYVIGSYVMFHMIKGTPFEFNGGAYDNLTMWEQIDNETLYTPARKFLILVPIGLFLVVTQFLKNNLKLFAINLFISFFCGILPKLPLLHRIRIYVPFITNPHQIS